MLEKLEESCSFSEESVRILNILGIEPKEINQEEREGEDNKSKQANGLDNEFVDEYEEEEDGDEEEDDADETSSQADDY